MIRSFNSPSLLSQTGESNVREFKSLHYRVKLAMLNVDSSYQRSKEKNLIEDIVANFNPYAVIPLLVGKRQDGTLWIVDGLQRLTALLIMEYIEWDCSIFPSKGPEHESLLFRLANNRKSVNAISKFKARLLEGEEVAVGVNRIVNNFGFIIPSSPTDRARTPASVRVKTFCCVGALCKAYNHPDGVKCLTFICRMLSKLWGEDDRKTEARVVSGFECFYESQRTIGIEEEKLITRLNTCDLGDLLTKSEDTIGYRRGTKFAERLLEVYSK